VAPAGSVPTFYFESLDVDVLERQGSCSKNLIAARLIQFILDDADKLALRLGARE
jgi:hypothetical protein